ncbi:MAG: xanthine dehydrogenase family protein molybdopterin-binding subunit [Thaumarchaeota archaeon]|nr:xanthine dehydrogenase family protein molybdopterin-binding subunit [Nitrososphaerota archaeon]
MYSGLELKRKEDPRFLTGRSTFVDDIQLPHMLYAAFLRSPYAHAIVKNVDPSDALTTKGVESVLIGSDGNWTAITPHIVGMKPYTRHALARGKVRYSGEPVAVVLARDRYLAEDGLESIHVDYDPLPVVASASDATKPNAPLVHEAWGDNVYLHYNHEFGNAIDALSKADLVFSETFKSSRYTGTPIEPRAILASYDPFDQMLTVWSATQMAHGFRSITSTLLGIPENRMHVIAPDVGGAFGIKTAGTPEDVMVCALAMKTGKPVKWIETRTENLLSSVHCHELVHDIEAGFSKSGKFLALRTKVTADIGAYTTIGGFEPVTHSWYYLPGQYDLPNYSVDVSCIATNKAPFGAVRGFGRVVGAFVMERVMEIAARKLGIDPAEIRYLNMIKPRDFPYTSVTGMYLDNNSFVECTQKALAFFDYKRWREEQKRLAKEEGRFVGIGISSSIGPSGLSASKTQGLPGYEPVRMALDPSGRATVYTGVCPHGQGHETILSQLAADQLGILFEDVTIVHGDTGSTPYSLGTWSDRSAVAAGTATILAAQKIRQKAIRIASHLLTIPEEELILSGGKVLSAKNPSIFMSLAEIGRIAYYRNDQLPPGMEPGLEFISVFDPKNVISQDAQGRRNESPTYSNSAHIAAVEVDPSTGSTKILRYVIAHDSGFVINPAIVDSIIHGCIAQGIGAGLCEELVYDKEGQLLTSSFMDYIIPSAEMIPPIDIIRVETPSPSTIIGFRGAGQSGSMATPAAIANAVEDALIPLGITIDQMPLTEQRIWEKIQRTQEKRL